MTAINILLEEHKLLLKAVETARNIQKIPDNEVYYTQIRGIILFFRNFTEIYHHPKEDNMLYPMLRNRSQVISSEFLYEVCDNHDERYGYKDDLIKDFLKIERVLYISKAQFYSQ